MTCYGMCMLEKTFGFALGVLMVLFSIWNSFAAVTLPYWPVLVVAVIGPTVMGLLLIGLLAVIAEVVK
jgi:hypothetical protein